jgi:hypothetical protein
MGRLRRGRITRCRRRRQLHRNLHFRRRSRAAKAAAHIGVPLHPNPKT